MGGNQFGEYDNVPPRVKNNGHNRSVQETPSREKYNPERINNSNWKVDFDISSSPPSSTTLSLITNDQITKLRANLCYEDKISLNAASLEELKWWCYNLKLNRAQPAFTCSKLTIEILEQGMKYVQS